MAALNEPRVGIVGLGAIGGSLALALLDRGVRPRGYSNYPGDAQAAASAGVAIGADVDDVVKDADIVLIATPLNVIEPVAEQIWHVLDEVDREPTVLHAGSLQRADALGPDRRVHERVIGSHPIAGTHGIGFAAAGADMFRGATVSVEARATARQRADAELLWSLAGAAHVVYADADEHDRRMAWLSHLPQLVATAAAATLSEARCAASELGPGGRDVTRLAESALGVWLPIIDRAPRETVEALVAMERTLARVRMLIQHRDWPALNTLWDDARRWRAELESKP